MPQDRASGAQANNYGREYSRRIADTLGAEMLTQRSNECSLGGERILIKCGRQRTRSVGVPYQLLDRVSAVVGAFEQEDGSYELLRLPAAEYASAMRPTR